MSAISETVRVLGKGAKERICRWAGPRSRRSLVIAGKLACMLDRFSSISRVAGFRTLGLAGDEEIFAARPGYRQT